MVFKERDESCIEENFQCYEKDVYEISTLNDIKNDCSQAKSFVEKNIRKKLHDNIEELSCADGGISSEAFDSSLIVTSESVNYNLSPVYKDTVERKKHKTKYFEEKKVHFKETECQYDNLRDNFGWWLNKKESRRKSYEEMIPINNTSDDIEGNRKTYVTKDKSDLKNKLSICLQVLKYFLFLLLFLIPLALILLSIFGFGLCDITPTVKDSLLAIGILLFIGFILSLILSLNWSKPIIIFLSILMIIILIILIGLLIFATYWLSDFYYLLQQQPVHCPVIYCSDRSIAAYVGIIIASWIALIIIIYLNRKQFLTICTCDNDKRNQNLNEDDISSKNELNSTHTLESNVTLNINPNSEEKNDLENMNKSHDGQNTNDLKLFEEIIEDPNKIIYKPSRGKPQILSSNEDTNILSMSQFLSFNYNYMDENFDNKVVDENNILNISTPDNEKYMCILPVVQKEEENKLSSYFGPHPAELIEPLIKAKVCSYLIDVYWSYEVCHGRYILQYHEDRDTRKRDEFYLGNIVFQTPKEKYFDHLNPPKKIINSVEVPYYSVPYKSGTVCDLTGKPRNTTLIYICVEKTKDVIISQVEVSSCQYEITVATERLCSHPSFKPKEKKENIISCFLKEPADREEPTPLKLSHDLKRKEKDLNDELSMILSNSVKIKIKNADNHIEFEVDNENEETIDNKKENDYEEFEKKNSDDNEISIEPSQLPDLDYFDTEDQVEIFNELKINKDIDYYHETSAGRQNYIAINVARKIAIGRLRRNFFTGRNCIVGGKGWWKHKFCLESHIEQFHGRPSDPDYKILNLGYFDYKSHLKWISSNKGRLPLIDREDVVQVRQLYVGGNVCDETGKHRQTEVRLRCDKQALRKGSEAVEIYLEEPTQCNYILTVSSGTFCGKMNMFLPQGFIMVDSDLLQKDVTEKIKEVYTTYSKSITKRRSYQQNNNDVLNKLKERVHDDL
uniref:Endoplasmic reticulum lectin 1 n=1 Tax=Parastrongyloides trichosuri TaxID=131310 RepID=A0A0N4ZG55_PARTI